MKLTYAPKTFAGLLLVVFTSIVSAQPMGQSPENLIQQALANSQLIAARAIQVKEAEQLASSVGSGKNPELELSPGLGFTNSNFAVGQSLDIFGQRAAASQQARAEVALARAGLKKAQLEVATEALNILAGYHAAVANEAIAKQGLEVAKATLAAIRKRVDIGEAPALQATRAEVELQRAEQSLILAQSDTKTMKASLNSLLGKSAHEDIQAYGWLGEVVLQSAEEVALSQRPELLEAMAWVEFARSRELVAKRQGQPSVFAGVATDTWSLNRNPFQRDNVGLQIRLSMPIFDRGEYRNSVRAAESARLGRERELESVQRRLRLEVESAKIHLAAARSISKSYDSGILPRADEMVRAMQSGLESGITNFLDVLEAQRSLAQLRREAAEAARNLRLAEVRYLSAIGTLPNLESK